MAKRIREISIKSQRGKLRKIGLVVTSCIDWLRYMLESEKEKRGFTVLKEERKNFLKKKYWRRNLLKEIFWRPL